jgi:hypothetical protein
MRLKIICKFYRTKIYLIFSNQIKLVVKTKKIIFNLVKETYLIVQYTHWLKLDGHAILVI